MISVHLVLTNSRVATTVPNVRLRPNRAPHEKSQASQIPLAPPRERDLRRAGLAPRCREALRPSAPPYPFSPNRVIIYSIISKARATNAGSQPHRWTGRPGHILQYPSSAAWQPPGLPDPSVMQAVLLQRHLGRPANFPSLAAAWFSRRRARWQETIHPDGSAMMPG